MLFIVCPTCGYFLAQKSIFYETNKEQICSNPKLSKEDKENELGKLLVSLRLKNDCCRMRMMSYKDIVYDILPASIEE